MLWRVEVFARWLFPITSALDTVVAGGDPSVLHLDVGRRMSELALRVGPGALVALKLSANLELEPPRVLAIE